MRLGFSQLDLNLVAAVRHEFRHNRVLHVAQITITVRHTQINGIPRLDLIRRTSYRLPAIGLLAFARLALQPLAKRFFLLVDDLAARDLEFSVSRDTDIDIGEWNGFEF